jgi:hypothetical protein
VKSEISNMKSEICSMKSEISNMKESIIEIEMSQRGSEFLFGGDFLLS